MKITNICSSIAICAISAGCGTKLPDCSDPKITKLANDIVVQTVSAQAEQTANRFLRSDIDEFTRAAFNAKGVKPVLDVSSIKAQLASPRLVDVKKEVGIVTCEANISDVGYFTFGYNFSSYMERQAKAAEEQAKRIAASQTKMDELAKLEGSAPIANETAKSEKNEMAEFLELAPLYSAMHQSIYKDGLKYVWSADNQNITMKVPAMPPAAVFRYTAQLIDKGEKVLVQAAQ